MIKFVSMDWLQTFHFLRPWWFLALIPLVLVGILLLFRRAKHALWEEHCDAELLPFLISTGSGGRAFKWSSLFLLFGWIIATIILAGPVWKKIDVPVYNNPLARVIVLDMSPSMLNSDLKPTRETRAKMKIIDLLKESQDTQNALIVFAHKAYVVSPLTNDNRTIISMMKALSPKIMPTTGDNPTAGLKEAYELIKQANETQNAQIILVTDSANSSTVEYAKELKEKGITTSVLAVGPTNHNASSDNYNPDMLKNVANSGNGEFTYLTANQSDIESLINAKNNAIQLDKLKKALSLIHI